MSGLTQQDDAETREPILDTVDRVSELCFGLFMALTFVGTVSATAGEDAGRKMLYTALGCNLAWGLADAVMYLVRTLTNRGRGSRLRWPSGTNRILPPAFARSAMRCRRP